MFCKHITIGQGNFKCTCRDVSVNIKFFIKFWLYPLLNLVVTGLFYCIISTTRLAAASTQLWICLQHTHNVKTFSWRSEQYLNQFQNSINFKYSVTEIRTMLFIWFQNSCRVKWNCLNAWTDWNKISIAIIIHYH